MIVSFVYFSIFPSPKLFNQGMEGVCLFVLALFFLVLGLSFFHKGVIFVIFWFGFFVPKGCFFSLLSLKSSTLKFVSFIGRVN